MRFIKTSLLLVFFCAGAASLTGQGLSISQIDTDRLLFTQNVRLYVSTPFSDSNDDSALDLEVWESGNGKDFVQRPVLSVSRKRNAEEGIHFYLLLDNSGSMWDSLDGSQTELAEEQRMTHAKNAVRNFVGELGPKDSLTLAMFNTRYWTAVESTGDRRRIERSLEDIVEPQSEDAYTELYLSLYRALDEFSDTRGRRVLIVLSDGENFPYYANTGKPNPETAVRELKPADVLDRAHLEGISVYVVHFGDDKDPDLASIANGTGSKVFDASNQDELATVYSTIHSDVLNELSVDYKASMESGLRRYVRVILKDQDNNEFSSERFYYSGTVLGWNDEVAPWYFLVFLLIPAALWLGLLFFRMERDSSEAALRLMYGPAGKSTQIFALNSAQTIIGSSAGADITIAGNKAVRERHATIMYDKKENTYTLVGDSNVTVNNRPVSKKRLESGDVINMSGTVAVFDDALVKALDKKREKKRMEASGSKESLKRKKD